MSNIDKRALREIAEAAVGAHERLSAMPPDDIFDISLAEGTQLDADTTALNALNSAANPDTVLALLDELEAKDKSIGFLKDQLAQLANFNPDWDKLEAATDSLREHMEELTAARKRIAELEAREVKLPNPHAHLIWIQAGHAPDDYWDDVAVSHSEKDKCCDGSDRYPVYALWEIKEALSAIGINIAADGKGEDS
ncbi:ead/Ea22-like family protein [Enterobacter kobei]|uniref:ead/Ea22-like family protein n=1 Tax=Enterobacter kobei TaxID=208224 RepID=UPI0006DA947F|nr:ead/Ea22-like family protein [Enterobacter kobei]